MLTIKAGEKAYRHIQEFGLSPQDITAVFGASGAAKWIAIYGLDSAVFADWLSSSSHTVDLFGTSVGAFKLAAAAQLEARSVLSVLADAYIGQDYVGKATSEQVLIETNKLLDLIINDEAIGQLLEHPRYNFHCASVRCAGGLASKHPGIQAIGMLDCFLRDLVGNKHLAARLERTIFYTGNTEGDLSGNDVFVSTRVPLTRENFRDAVLSSGSIPLMMPGIEDIEGAEPGMYRDGGLLDYHPVPSSITKDSNGLVLYPHFYRHLKQVWFDKYFPWRTVGAEHLENVVLISPSEEFINSLPFGRIPDRHDFKRFQKRDHERLTFWNEVKDRSLELGEEFLRLVKSGGIAEVVEPMS